MVPVGSKEWQLPNMPQLALTEYIFIPPHIYTLTSCRYGAEVKSTWPSMLPIENSTV